VRAPSSEGPGASSGVGVQSGVGRRGRRAAFIVARPDNPTDDDQRDEDQNPEADQTADGQNAPRHHEEPHDDREEDAIHQPGWIERVDSVERVDAGDLSALTRHDGLGLGSGLPAPLDEPPEHHRKRHDGHARQPDPCAGLDRRDVGGEVERDHPSDGTHQASDRAGRSPPRADSPPAKNQHRRQKDVCEPPGEAQHAHRDPRAPRGRPEDERQGGRQEPEHGEIETEEDDRVLTNGMRHRGRQCLGDEPEAEAECEKPGGRSPASDRPWVADDGTERRAHRAPPVPGLRGSVSPVARRGPGGLSMDRASEPPANPTP
jgi:hypothetical protein